MEDTNTIFAERYRRIRMAVFDPEYLIRQGVFDEGDFELLLDTIVGLQEKVRLLTRQRDTAVKRSAFVEKALDQARYPQNVTEPKK